MRPVIAIALALLTAHGTAAKALALGADHPQGPLHGASYWTEGLRSLVNHDARIHGYFVNAEDIFFFAGDTRALNPFLAEYARLKDAKLRVVLHRGPAEAKSPWDENGPFPSASWRLYSAPRDWIKHTPQANVTDDDPPLITRLDIWLGGAVVLDKLDVPAGLSVEAGKPTEPDAAIQKFLEKHRAKSHP